MSPVSQIKHAKKPRTGLTHPADMRSLMQKRFSLLQHLTQTIDFCRDIRCPAGEDKIDSWVWTAFCMPKLTLRQIRSMHTQLWCECSTIWGVSTSGTGFWKRRTRTSSTAAILSLLQKPGKKGWYLFRGSGMCRVFFCGRQGRDLLSQPLFVSVSAFLCLILLLGFLHLFHINIW